MPPFALLLIVSFLNGKLLNTKCKEYKLSDRMLICWIRVNCKGGVGVEQRLFEWSLSWIQVLTLQPFDSQES